MKHRRPRSPSERALPLTGSGRWQAAKRACRAAVEADPTDVRSRALLEYLAARTGDVVDDEAEGRILALADEHPDLPHLRMYAAFTRWLWDRPGAAEDLRRLADAYPDDGLIQLNAALHVSALDVEGGWPYVRRAVELGGFRNRPGARVWAYRYARKLGQEEFVRQVLLDPLPPLQQAAVRTLAAPDGMWLVWANSIVAGAGLATVVGSAPLAMALSLAAFALSLWLSGTRLSVCRSRACVARALGLVGVGREIYLPVVVVLAWLVIEPRTTMLGWILIGYAAADTIWWLLVRKVRGFTEEAPARGATEGWAPRPARPRLLR